MKLFKQITCAVLTLCLCAGLLLIPSAPVSAATGPSAPKAVDVSYYKNYPMVNDSAISVQLGTNGKNIKNIKTSSKNLKAKVTRLSLSSSSNSGYVGVYAKKTGKYTVSFDVYNAQNKKIKKFTVKVNVTDPTNHLDMESITALNNGLIKFSGVALFTSHDHQFIQTTANRIMEIVPSGQLIDKITTYDEYLENDEMARKRQGYAEAAEDDN